jgi:hypothetical protein
MHNLQRYIEVKVQVAQAMSPMSPAPRWGSAR